MVLSRTQQALFEGDTGKTTAQSVQKEYNRKGKNLRRRFKRTIANRWDPVVKPEKKREVEPTDPFSVFAAKVGKLMPSHVKRARRRIKPGVSIERPVVESQHEANVAVALEHILNGMPARTGLFLEADGNSPITYVSLTLQQLCEAMTSKSRAEARARAEEGDRRKRTKELAGPRATITTTAEKEAKEQNLQRQADTSLGLGVHSKGAAPAPQSFVTHVPPQAVTGRERQIRNPFPYRPNRDVSIAMGQSPERQLSPRAPGREPKMPVGIQGARIRQRQAASKQPDKMRRKGLSKISNIQSRWSPDKKARGKSKQPAQPEQPKQGFFSRVFGRKPAAPTTSAAPAAPSAQQPQAQVLNKAKEISNKSDYKGATGKGGWLGRKTLGAVGGALVGAVSGGMAAGTSGKKKGFLRNVGRGLVGAAMGGGAGLWHGAKQTDTTKGKWDAFAGSVERSAQAGLAGATAAQARTPGAIGRTGAPVGRLVGKDDKPAPQPQYAPGAVGGVQAFMHGLKRQPAQGQSQQANQPSGKLIDKTKKKTSAVTDASQAQAPQQQALPASATTFPTAPQTAPAPTPPPPPASGTTDDADDAPTSKKTPPDVPRVPLAQRKAQLSRLRARLRHKSSRLGGDKSADLGAWVNTPVGASVFNEARMRRGLPPIVSMVAAGRALSYKPSHREIREKGESFLRKEGLSRGSGYVARTSRGKDLRDDAKKSGKKWHLADTNIPTRRLVQDWI